MSPQNAEASADPAVNAIVARAAETARRPTGEHNALFAGLIEELQRELDADPVADISATSATDSGNSATDNPATDSAATPRNASGAAGETLDGDR